MRHPEFRLGPALWVLCACLLLLSRAAAAGEPALAVDFDGDGRRDTVRLDHQRPSVLRVWLSATGTTQVLVSRGALRHVAATDLDGDHRPELIASDGESRIHVWKHLSRGFRRYQPRAATPKVLAPPTRRCVDGGDRAPEEALVDGGFIPPALVRASLPAFPEPASRACVPSDESTCPASPAARPFSARPPPY